MAFFCIAVLVFQQFIDMFNTDMHLLTEDIHHLEYYHIIEISEDGYITTLEEIQRERERFLEYQEFSEGRSGRMLSTAEFGGGCAAKLQELRTDRTLGLGSKTDENQGKEQEEYEETGEVVGDEEKHDNQEKAFTND